MTWEAELLEKMIEGVRLGFEIARDKSYINTNCFDDPEIEWKAASRALETAIENMRAAVSVS